MTDHSDRSSACLDSPTTCSIDDLGEKAELFSVRTMDICPSVEALIWKVHWFRPMDYLRRHLRGDWGDWADGDADIAATNDSVVRAKRGHVFSSYKLQNRQRLEILTNISNGSTSIYLFGLPSSRRQ